MNLSRFRHSPYPPFLLLRQFHPSSFTVLIQSLNVRRPRNWNNLGQPTHTEQNTSGPWANNQANDN
jgi:hypothetical protein